MRVNGRKDSIVRKESFGSDRLSSAYVAAVRFVEFRTWLSRLRTANAYPVCIGKSKAGEHTIVVFACRRDMLACLTKREREVLALVGYGFGNKGIAYRLGIGQGTVKKHFVSMNKKLGVLSRAELARLATVALPVTEQAPPACKKADCDRGRPS